MAENTNKIDPSQENEATLEENFEKLDTLIAQLENSDAPLEEAFASYSKGVELIRTCNAQIDRVEKQVQVLKEDGSTDVYQ